MSSREVFSRKYVQISMGAVGGATSSLMILIIEAGDVGGIGTQQK